MSAASPLTPGIAYLVGAGPGDPGLLTVRGRELLGACDAVVHDALANPALLSRPPVAQTAKLFDVGKRGGDAGSVRQSEINELLIALAKEGKTVVRLKGGDPFVFGRGGEEAQALNDAGVPFEIVPGVTAGIAAPAYAGIPVTHRGLSTSVTFVTGSEDPNKETIHANWQALAQVGGTLVLYMGVKTLPRIVAELLKGGLPPEIPAVAIEWGTYPRQRTIEATLATLVAKLEKERVAPPVITVIGWTAVLRDELAWFDRRPLFGKRVVITRAGEASDAQSLGARLRALGADVIDGVVTQLEPVDLTPLKSALSRLSEFDWVAFTSKTGVRVLWEALRAAGGDARAFARVKLCAVGPSTADALRDRGLMVDVVAERFVAEGLLKALGERSDVRGSRVLYAAAAGAREVLPAGLEALGATVERIELYRSVPDISAGLRLREMLEKRRPHLVTFTSASAVRAYAQAVGREIAAAVPGASIGPVTTQAVRDSGITLAIEASESTFDGLAKAIRNWAERNGTG